MHKYSLFAPLVCASAEEKGGCSGGEQEDGYGKEEEHEPGGRMSVVGVDPPRREDAPPDREQRCRPEGKECVPEGAAALFLLLLGEGAAVCFDDEIDEPREQKGAGGAICTPRQGGRKNQTGVESGRRRGEG